MEDIQFVTILETLEDNTIIQTHPITHDVVSATVEYYKTIGFHSPWIGYIAVLNGQVVGSGGFKGGPKENKVELAYGCFDKYQHQGIGTAICKKLIEIAQDKQPDIIITARTLLDNIYSQRVLEKNGFVFEGMVMDPDDGEVMEWKYKQSGSPEVRKSEST